MTPLETLAYLGEIIGSIAVVVSLIYLAVQVRQNTQAQHTENFYRALDRQAAIQAAFSQDSEIGLLVAKGVTGSAKLSPKQRLQFTWAMYELFGAFEFMFLMSKSEAISDEVWTRWSAVVAWWLTFPGVQTWWKIRPTPFTDSFTSYVEELLAANPTDPETVSRYQDYVAHGSPPPDAPD